MHLLQQRETQLLHISCPKNTSKLNISAKANIASWMYELKSDLRGLFSVRLCVEMFHGGVYWHDLVVVNIVMQPAWPILFLENEAEYSSASWQVIISWPEHSVYRRTRCIIFTLKLPCTQHSEAIRDWKSAPGQTWHYMYASVKHWNKNDSW